MDTRSMPGYRLVGICNLFVILLTVSLFFIFLFSISGKSLVGIMVWVSGLILVLIIRVLVATLESTHTIISLQAAQLEKLQEMIEKQQKS